MIDYAMLMTQAEMVRKNLGEDSGSPVDIFALAQYINKLTIVFYPFGNNISGMCVKGYQGNDLVAINSAMTLGRQRFTMAHEFYHLFVDETKKTTVCNMKLNTGKETEKSADMFASYFLMPNSALLPIAKALADENNDKMLSLNDVIRIEQYFGMSHQAVVYRLMHTKYLGEKGKDFLNCPVRAKAEALGYSSALYRPLPENKKYMTFGNYIKQAESVIERELVSYGKYEELLLDAYRADLVFGSDNEEGDVID